MKILVALGGNALLRRGETLSAYAQQKNITSAAEMLACEILAGHQLIITHGNGPQVGLLALQSAAGPLASVMPLDVLGAESEGWIGYSIELALRNALPPGANMVAMLTQTLVDHDDVAFQHPSKFVGPIYDKAEASNLAYQNHWTIGPDGTSWRRVVASPKPIAILELESIRLLVQAGVTVICGGGGGIPIVRQANGTSSGIEAVIDKDTTSALLAEQLDADLFIMLTDVPGVYRDYGIKSQCMIKVTDAETMLTQLSNFSAGSMAPKIAAACSFVQNTKKLSIIGAIPDLHEIIAGTAGTTITPNTTKHMFARPG
jgi:carbamate kinase